MSQSNVKKRWTGIIRKFSTGIKDDLWSMGEVRIGKDKIADTWLDREFLKSAEAEEKKAKH